jgi:hypothetical protein
MTRGFLVFKLFENNLKWCNLPSNDFRMRQHLFGFALAGLFLGFTHLQTLAFHSSTSSGSSKPTIGLGLSRLGYTPSDSSFSIKLSDAQRLSKGQTTLILNLGAYKQLKYVKVYDLIGRKVHFQYLPYQSSIVKINMASLKPGIYFCSVYSSQGLVETRKLIHL